mgnify:CR=1 FL=1
MKICRVVLSLLVLLAARALPAGAEEKPLPAFGYDIFREAAEPVLEGPVDDNYVLSPGDEVIISIWGQVNQTYPLTVGEDGFITIPDGGGRVYTNGVSLKEFRGMVLRSLSQAYSTYINADDPTQSTAFVDVKLGKLRRLFVFVVGEVRKQGALSVSPGAATLLNLLNNAGGVKESGSLRQVRIRRSAGAGPSASTPLSWSGRRITRASVPASSANGSDPGRSSSTVRPPRKTRSSSTARSYTSSSRPSKVWVSARACAGPTTPPIVRSAPSRPRPASCSSINRIMASFPGGVGVGIRDDGGTRRGKRAGRRRIPSPRRRSAHAEAILGDLARPMPVAGRRIALPKQR